MFVERVVAVLPAVKRLSAEETLDIVGGFGVGFPDEAGFGELEHWVSGLKREGEKREQKNLQGLCAPFQLEGISRAARLGPWCHVHQRRSHVASTRDASS